jgi:hypothetical protein
VLAMQPTNETGFFCCRVCANVLRCGGVGWGGGGVLCSLRSWQARAQKKSLQAARRPNTDTTTPKLHPTY